MARWAQRRVQVGMGLALLVAAALMLRQLTQGAPVGAAALSLEGPQLAIGAPATSSWER